MGSDLFGSFGESTCAALVIASGSKDMIAWSKSIADHFGIPLMMGIVSSERTQAKVRLLKRQLGEPVGAFFMYGQKQAAGAR